MTKYLIYGLYCPFTDNIHYVGKSSSYMTRPASHLTKSHSEKIQEWVEHLKLLGYKPVVKILEECSSSNLDERELYWIDKCKKDGAYLLNVSHNSTSSILMGLPVNDGILLKKLGDSIKRVRKEQGITQDELSKAANIGRNTLFLMESGNGGVAIKYIMKVLALLNLELNVQTKGNDSSISET